MLVFIFVSLYFTGIECDHFIKTISVIFKNLPKNEPMAAKIPVMMMIITKKQKEAASEGLS